MQKQSSKKSTLLSAARRAKTSPSQVGSAASTEAEVLSSSNKCASMKVSNWREKMDSAHNLEQLARSITGGSRYFKLNVQSYWRHGTVEFRQHSGTVEFGKIRNWLLFCARLVDFSKRERLDSGGERALAKLLDNELANFYKQRKEKFGRR